MRPLPSSANWPGEVEKAIIVPRGVDGGEPPRHAAVPAPFEWIVATGVEDDDVGGGVGLLHLGDHAIEGQRAVLGIDLVLDLGVDGREIIVAVDLKAVPRKRTARRLGRRAPL